MNNDSISRKIAELFDLFKSGALTKREYELLKGQFLDSSEILTSPVNEDESTRSNSPIEINEIDDNETNNENSNPPYEDKNILIRETKVDELIDVGTVIGMDGNITKPKSKTKIKRFIFISILLVSIGFGLFVLIQVFLSKSEQKEIALLLKSKDIIQAYEFKTNHPKSVFNIDSLILEIEFYKLKTSQNIQDYENFLNLQHKIKVKNTIYFDTVKSRLYQLAWNKILESPSAQAVEKYLNNYPISPKYSEAENLLFKIGISGTFTDKRDGQKYSWSKIGNQVWMTQDLKYATPNSKNYKSGTRFYPQSDIFNACPKGWDIPTLDEWLTLAFELKGKLHVIRRSPDEMSIRQLQAEKPIGQYFITIGGEDMNEGGAFKPSINLQFEDNVGRNAYSGEIDYWTKKYTKQIQTDFGLTDVNYDAFSWKPKSSSTNSKKISDIWIHGIFREGAIRCINRKYSSTIDSVYHSSSFTGSSDLIIINGETHKLKDLPPEGMYLRTNAKDKESNSAAVIKYVGTKLFFFLGEDMEFGGNDIFINYHLEYSADKRKFIVLNKNSTSSDELGSLSFNINSNIIVLIMTSNNQRIEYHLIPNMAFQF